MAYERHEMNVLLFSRKDDVFADDVDLTSDQDNEWDDSQGSYSDDDNPISSFDW